VVVILIPRWEGCRWTVKTAVKRDSLGTDAKATRKINRREIKRGCLRAYIAKGPKSLFPISISIGILSAQPPAKVSIVKVKPLEGARILHGTVQRKTGGTTWGRPGVAKRGY
jgi:hypothetical protein